MEELWGEAPPRSALTTLQTYILHLRRNIDAALPPDHTATAMEILVTRYNGYMLNVPAADVDAKRYEMLASAGRRAADAGDDSDASRLLQDALDIWRGEILVDVQIGMRLGLEVAWFEESRLGVLEARLDADLRLGRHNLLLSELSMLTARYPMNENLCTQFMIALYRAGRQWQALKAFQSLRDALVEDLGVEPSTRVQNLQRAILNADASLDMVITDEQLQSQLLGTA
jgi:DNA-binding SARP family transcriptional activator